MRKKYHDKKQLIIQHRRERYNHAIQRYIDGEVPYSYVVERWNKLKIAEGKL